jgi:type I restriction enzyme S subunit
MKIKQALVPKLRFGEFDSKVELSTLGNQAKIYDGTHQTPKYTKAGIPFVSVENIKNIHNTNKFVSPEAYEKDYKHKPQTNDILMTRITAGVIGATALVQDSSPLAYYVSLALIRTTSLLPKFLEHQINSPYFKRELHKRIIHVAFPKKINLGDIGDCNIAFPSLPEQEKIAAFLTSVDDRIDQLKRKKSLLQDYKKGAMQKLFSQELRFKDEQGKDFPDWEVKKLGEVAEVIMGQSPDSRSYNEIGNGLPLIQGNADIKKRKSCPRIWTSEPTKVCVDGDLLLTVRAPVGAVAKSEHHACLGRGVASIKSKPTATQGFIYQWLLEFEPRWIRLEQGSTFTAVSGADIRGLAINVPSVPEQAKIANFLSSLDQKLEQIDTQITQTQTFKKGLLQQMFV